MNHPTTSRTAVAGRHAAGLREAIAADPAAPLVAGIQGLGGYGKTALLSDVAALYRDAGVPVLNAAAPVERAAEGVVLVDDAHRLDSSGVDRLRRIAEQPGARLILAYRPGPQSQALGELAGAPFLLSGLDHAEIAQLATRLLGVAGSAEWLEWVRAYTGGVPRFVSRVLEALTPDQVGRIQLPPRAFEHFRHDLDQLGEVGRDCLLAVAVGATPHPDLLAWLLDLDSATVGAAMADVRASGLLDAQDTPLPIARTASLALTPGERRLRVTRRLVRAQLDRGAPVLPLVRPLIGLDVAMLPDPTMAEAFAKAAGEAVVESPRLALQLLDAAVSAGVPAARVAAHRARAAAAAGDLEGALRIADQVIVDETVPDRALGVQVAASVLAHRGLLARSAELCEWSVRELRWPGDTAFAVVGLIGSGRLEEAQELLRSSRDPGPPTSLSGAAAQLAEGMHESVAGSAATALSTLVRSVSLSEAAGRGLVIPDSPAAVAAVVAMQCGELEVAESVLDRAFRAATGGPLLHLRHWLLATWLPLLRGDTVAVSTKLGAVVDLSAMGVRDRLLATAIQAGIANRDNDMTALATARSLARQAIAEHPVDLFSLLPLGELVVAAARLRDDEWLAPHVREARALLSRLGNPPLWTAPLVWKSLQASIIVEDLDQASQHSADLDAMAGHNATAAAMAEAARVWLRVLAGQIDHDEAEQAARGLHAAGLAWDGARLAGQAAIRTTDRRTMLALLECARSLQGKPPRPRAVGTPAAGDANLLSAREKEVAELVLAGLTYKQVGKRLFISAKTVEHHIGRVKQRLGCASREDLLNRLRELLGHP